MCAASDGSGDEETVLEYAIRQRLTPKNLTALLKFFGERAEGTPAEMAERLLLQKALKLNNVLDKLSDDDLKVIVRRYQIPERAKPAGAVGVLRAINTFGDPRGDLTKRIEEFAATQRPPRPRAAQAAPVSQPVNVPSPPARPPAVERPIPAPPTAAQVPERSHPISTPGPAPPLAGTHDQAQFEGLCHFLESYTFTRRWSDEASYEAELGGAIAGRFSGQKVVHQMAVGGTRADLVALGAVIEIKYPKTKQPLQTLTGQVEGYERLFPGRVIVVLCTGGITDTQALNDSAASLTERGARVFIK